ncbi:hypothetical protein SAMN00808754_1904 [Thermanaeromonas toyohensis ToBE]|uniref:Uncharacterized protein n=1 Tax=Thermanaeromonas toyohensis ToBE TaxID=698762 RepID=A0A1W1VW98_9FIRM|nr:hypothetical protein [Thermanaeromonas toyohensis]SMB97645.1 hypothetical protein SAMN00808754_1904 [Thermanaeromonas toyohensis ToBE]
MNMTIILRALGAPDPSLQGFLERLGVALDKRSFRVLGLPPKSSDGKLFRLWQANLLLIIADRSLDKTYLEPTLRFFHSFKKAEESLGIIAAIVQEMLLNRDRINYSLARKWEHIIRPTYFRLLQDSDVPAILLELHGSRILEVVGNGLENRIVEGITRYFKGLYQGAGDDSICSCSARREGVGQLLPSRKEEPTEVNQDINGMVENNQEAIVSLALETGERASPLERQKSQDFEEVQEEGQEYAAEMKSNEKEPQEEEVKEVSHNGEKQLDKETPRLELPLTEAKLKRRPRHWGSNPLAPPGDGPIYYFEPYSPAELPPSILSSNTFPALRVPDPLSSLKELALSLKRVTRNEKPK